MPDAEFSTPTQSVSGILGTLRTHLEKQGRMPLSESIDLFGERSILVVLLFFALLNSLPVSLPGFSTITGIPIMILGVQLLIGIHHVWLPQKVRNYTLTQEKMGPRLQKLHNQLQKWEHWIRPRYPFMTTPVVFRLLGLIFVIMAILLALPVPFLNFPSGFTMSILAIGMIERDGLIIGIALSLVAAVVAGIFLLTL